MGQVTLDNIREVMTYHAPSPEQVAKMEDIREKAIALGESILSHCPPCADTSAALRQLRETRMTANAAIVLNGLV